MEIREPRDPPKKEENKRNASEIRYFPLIAFLLSIRKRRKQKILINKIHRIR